MKYYLSPWKNILKYRGRSGIIVFWTFHVVNFLLTTAMLAGLLWCMNRLGDYHVSPEATNDLEVFCLLVKEHWQEAVPALLLVVVMPLFYLGSTLAGLALFVRRLQDIGISGIWVWPLLLKLLFRIILLPLGAKFGLPSLNTVAITFDVLCLLYFIVIGFMPGTAGENRYGATATGE